MISRQLINTFKSHCIKKYGEPVGKVVLETGYICPNSKNGRCIYCNPDSFRPKSLIKGESFERQFEKGKESVLKRKGVKSFFAYFQQETSTAGEIEKILKMFEFPLMDPLCRGIIISTRPDYITIPILEGLSKIHSKVPDKEFILEIGLQSANDRTLKILNRNHSLKDFLESSNLLKEYPFIQLGVHLIMAMPWENEKEMINSVSIALQSGASHLKIHHLQVIKETKLHEIFIKNPFKLPQEDEYLDLLVKILPIIPYNVVIHRLWNDAPYNLVVAPHWEKNKQALYNLLIEKMKNLEVKQGKEVD